MGSEHSTSSSPDFGFWNFGFGFWIFKFWFRVERWRWLLVGSEHSTSSPDISGQWTSREDALYTGHPLILNLRNFSIK